MIVKVKDRRFSKLLQGPKGKGGPISFRGAGVQEESAGESHKDAVGTPVKQRGGHRS